MLFSRCQIVSIFKLYILYIHNVHTYPIVNNFSIYKCYRNARDNNDIPWPCSEAQIVETCIKETNKNCMGLYHRQFPMFVANEVIERYNGPEGRGVLPKCLKAFPSDTTDDYDDEFPTLKKLDDELNRLLKNH